MKKGRPGQVLSVLVDPALGETMRRVIERTSVDLVILDLTMPNDQGEKLIRDILKHMRQRRCSSRQLGRVDRLQVSL